MLGDRSTDDDHRRIEDVHQTDGEVRERALRAHDEPGGARLAALGRGVDRRCVFDAVVLRELRAGSERFDTAERSTPTSRHVVARWTRWVGLESDGPVADLARSVRHPAQHAAGGHDAAADTGRHGHVDEVLRAARRADETFGDRGHAGIAIEVHARAERVGQSIGERDVAEPDQVGSLDDAPADVIERTWRRASGRDHIARLHGGGAQRVERARDDRGNDRVGAFPRRMPLIARDDRRDPVIDHRDDAADGCATQVDAKVGPLAQTLGSFPARSGPLSAEVSLPKTLCAALYPRFALSRPKAFSASV